MAPHKIETVARAVYRETKEFYERIRPRLGDADFGYRILYGPPMLRPPAMFIGIRPGGREDDRAHLDEREIWPSQSDYALAGWQFATRLQRIFTTDFLHRCTGTNESFLRGPTETEYERLLVDSKRTVEEIREFCRPHVWQLVRAFEPAHVIFIGLAAFRRLTGRGVVVHRSQKNGNPLVESATFAGRPAIGVPHFSTPLNSDELVIVNACLFGLESPQVPPVNLAEASRSRVSRLPAKGNKPPA